jgi:hypothetical protein
VNRSTGANRPALSRSQVVLPCRLPSPCTCNAALRWSGSDRGGLARKHHSFDADAGSGASASTVRHSRSREPKPKGPLVCCATVLVQLSLYHLPLSLLYDLLLFINGNKVDLPSVRVGACYGERLAVL